MAYVIYSFDGVSVPTYLQDGDQQNIGTGAALTNFVQLASGNFFDNYGSGRSPRGIRSITKTGYIWGATAADTKDTLDTWRSKIGVRAKLYVQYDDATQRWQWARLENVSSPRRGSDKGDWIAVDFTWVTADQWWRGTAHPTGGWVWGDSTWTFGDGTATFGEDYQTFTLDANPDSFTLSNGGNIDTNNLRMSIIPSEAMSFLSISNYTNAAVIGYTGTVAAGQELIIDCGAMSVTLNGNDAFSSFYKLHTAAPWMPLSPGDNSLSILYTAADSLTGDDMLFSWTDAWA